MSSFRLFSLGRIVLASAVFGCFLVAGPAAAIQLDFSSEPNSYLQFNPDGSVLFMDETRYSFDDIRITASDGAGDGVGLTGDIDGVFSMGTITSFGVGMETAAVTGAGFLIIDDGAGSALSADVTFGDLTTFGTGGIANLLGSVNLSNFVYGGSNLDLSDLAASTDGVMTASFSIQITESLTVLRDSGGQVGNYSGLISGNPGPIPGNAGGVTPMPEPTAALCFALGLASVGSALRRRSGALRSQS
ncbi:MAG: hypothetical protein JRH19_05400 [Deltaproteobacteria bacterium]|nr:hypothetical protein [Deltaproteobacteria bacterium]